jgi:23S rRNA pseudouridine955/2504/2580 synthase
MFYSAVRYTNAFKKERRIMSRIIASTIPDGIFPIRIDKYLSERFDYLSRSAWQKEIESGKLTLNGITCRSASQKIKSGDALSYDGREIVEPDVDTEFSILYENEIMVVLDKPGDLPVHPAGRYFNNTLTMLYEKRYEKKIFPVHRLDRETSGIVLCAKKSEDAAALSKALSDGVKEYIAIVEGIFPDNKMLIDVPIGHDAESPVMKKRKAFSDAEESACTVIKKITTFGLYSLVRCYPQTGRLHQIRVHLLYAGYPIVGDKIYGGDETCFLDFIDKGMTESLRDRLTLPRCALHAVKLKIKHPVTKKEMLFNSPMPLMFRDFILTEKADG